MHIRLTCRRNQVSTADLLQYLFRVSSSQSGNEGITMQRTEQLLRELAHTSTEDLLVSSSDPGCEAPVSGLPRGKEGLAGVKWNRSQYFSFAAGWMRRNAERTHNACIVNCSTPAQYFHALRRQIHRPFAKPLICMAPKYLLHHRACMSNLADIGPNTFFRRLIVEQGPGDNMAARKHHLVPHEQIRKVVLCSGQIFYELFHARTVRHIHDITLVRLEQIAPFPFDRIAAVVRRYPNAEWCWVQPEPKNMGAWSYVQPRFMTAVRKLCHNEADNEAAAKYSTKR